MQCIADNVSGQAIVDIRISLLLTSVNKSRGTLVRSLLYLILMEMVYLVSRCKVGGAAILLCHTEIILFTTDEAARLSLSAFSHKQDNGLRPKVPDTE